MPLVLWVWWIDTDQLGFSDQTSFSEFSDHLQRIFSQTVVMADESCIHPNVPPIVLFTTSFHQIPPPLQNTQKSPSIAGSTTSDRGLQDSIRNGDNVDEDLIQSYVMRLFTGYLDNKVRDYSLWQSLLYDFEDFTEYHWTFLESQQWDLVQKVCYTQGIWLNHPGKRGSRAQIMPIMLQGDYYDN